MSSKTLYAIFAILFFAGIAMCVAGIWSDIRWIPTAILVGVVAFAVFALAEERDREEDARRVAKTKAEEDEIFDALDRSVMSGDTGYSFEPDMEAMSSEIFAGEIGDTTATSIQSDEKTWSSD